MDNKLYDKIHKKSKFLQVVQHFDMSRSCTARRNLENDVPRVSALRWHWNV